MAKVPGKTPLQELESLKKKYRVANVFVDNRVLPEMFAQEFVPQFTTRELTSLARSEFLSEDENIDKNRCLFKYKTLRTVNRGDTSRNRYGSGFNSGYNRNSSYTVMETKNGKVTELASRSLKEGGAYMVSVQSTIAQLKTRELLDDEKYMVEALARMEMLGVKREKEADNAREALQEWIVDAKILEKLNDKGSFFSIVSKIHDEEKRMKIHDEKAEEDEKKADEDGKLSLTFTTRFFGKDYVITVEMPNETEIRVKTQPHLKGVEGKITKILTYYSLLDAVTGDFWKMAAVSE